MSTLTKYDCAILARQRLNLPTSEVPRLVTYVDSALENLATRIASDSPKRSLLLTDRNTVTAAITNTNERYYADVTSIISTYGVKRETMAFGTVYRYYTGNTFASTDISTGTDAVTFLAATGWPTGLKVRLTTDGVLPTPLEVNTDYYLIAPTATTIQFATSFDNAVAGTDIDITNVGSGNHTIVIWEQDIVQWVDMPEFAQLDSALPITHLYGWLVQSGSNDYLYLSGTPSGTLAFEVPFVPTLTTLPARLEDDLITEMVRIATTAGMTSE